jgi:transcriptional regulator with PAS, ATPase and Fis domain
MKVDCASIPEPLIESELFGYEKGAFTGAISQGKPGFFELAEKGTLYLDEIGSITLGSQAKLLRFLEDNEVVRIGATKAKKIDVRVITTTNKDIPELIRTGKFRKDLFFRLNVIPLHIPPLRERREDILPLVNFFLGKLNKKFGTKKKISPKALKCMTNYIFPGNVRELANIIERAVILSEGQEISVSDFPVEVAGDKEYSGILPSREAGLSLKEKTRGFEAMLIAKALRKCGSQRKAAKILRVDQSTIARKVRQFGLSKEIIVE